MVLCLFWAGVLAVTGLSEARGAVDPTKPAQDRLKLYWFVPDGMRAEPELFDIYRWAREGKLPNIKRMMEQGTYGYAKPVFPSHTPANFASLFTGCYPEVHGVNDGPMHTEGNPLGQVSVPGFSSTAKKVEPIWVTLENALKGRCLLLSVPGSTPPELKNGITIHGRWGRWGADFPAINFQDASSTLFQQMDPKNARLFYQGPRLTEMVSKRFATGWGPAFRSYSPPFEAELRAWGTTTYAFISDNTNNKKVDYDRIVFSTNKTDALCAVRQGEWSQWVPITLQWQIPGQTLEQEVATTVKIKVIRLQENGQFRLRFYFNSLNRHLTEPGYIAEELLNGAGPMVDFVDNFPPQLIYFPEDKQTFLEEAELSLNWHRQAARFLLKTYEPRVYIQNIYTPNQMLTSRWWMGHVDPSSARYGEVTAAQRQQLWKEVQWLYQKLDAIVGAILAQADANTIVALSSDHGAVPLDSQVRLNNLFAREGWLKFKIDPATRERTIDWAATKVVYLQMHNVYIHPDGLAGAWQRASGPAYEKLREQVQAALAGLTAKNGDKIATKIVAWEKAPDELRLTPERVGDLVIANHPGYSWTEEVTADGEIFTVPRITGYKQAILSENVKGLWTPFMMMGPGVRKGHFLGETPLNLIDEYPTLLQAIGVEPPAWVQGKVVKEALQR